MPQSLSDASPTPAAVRGRSAWVLSDGKAGHQAITTGVAEALGVDYQVKILSPRGPWRLLAPWAPVDPRESPTGTTSPLAPPWPDFALAAGRLTIPAIRALKRAAGRRIFTAVFQDPRTGSGLADLVWVPEHDRLRGTNVVTTLTAPHPFGPARLAELRRAVPPAIAVLPCPRVALLIGGASAAYHYDSASYWRLTLALTSLVTLGAGFMITPSRRTPPALYDAVEEATRSAPRLLHDGSGDNPYPQILAHADAFVVTADSVNMTGEACATGRPVYVFTPAGGAPKFRRFHAALEAHGATRRLPDHFPELPVWSYPPLDAAAGVAEAIVRQWHSQGGH